MRTIYSGVMRITVTVVVIMFELTGALTYILPTMVCASEPRPTLRADFRMQIVLLVTKSVGDFFDARGIADEMIRFNGYPYLEEEEHVSHIPGTRFEHCPSL